MFVASEDFQRRDSVSTEPPCEPPPSDHPHSQGDITEVRVGSEFAKVESESLLELSPLENVALHIFQSDVTQSIKV